MQFIDPSACIKLTTLKSEDNKKSGLILRMKKVVNSKIRIHIRIQFVYIFKLSNINNALYLKLHLR